MRLTTLLVSTLFLITGVAMAVVPDNILNIIDAGSVVGYQLQDVGAVPGCNGPCTTKTFSYYECTHINPPGDTTCQTTSCIQDVNYYASCTAGNAEANQCVTGFDPAAISLTQTVVAPYGGGNILNCGVLNGPFGPVPGAPAGQCDAGAILTGKCFIGFFGDCDGANILNAAPRLGREACAGN